MPELASGLILAGGQGRRMGGRDKGLVEYQGRALVDHVIARIRPQVNELLISANRNTEVYARRGYPVLADSLPGFQGPLAGVLEGLRVARNDWLLCVPCDMPNLPQDLLARMMQVATGFSIVIAIDDERSHPAVMLIRRSLATELEAFIQSGQRAMHKFQTQIGFASTRFEQAQMQNVNRLD